MPPRNVLSPLVAALAILPLAPLAAAPLSYRGAAGPGAGKHVVLIAGDEEYRSEEALPMLARVLAFRHGFTATVLFPVNEKGEIDPDRQDSLDHPEIIDQADLLVLGLRFRRWPDEVMAKFVAALDRGVPVIGLRTSTHAFNYPGDSPSPFKRYGWRNDQWPGGFGRQILGETWIAHHGQHAVEGTRGVVEPGQENHPILRGVQDVFGDSDVYTANPPDDAAILMRGLVTATLQPDSPPVEGPKNNPPQPIAWTRVVERGEGVKLRVFTTTMGAATDLASEGLRRMVVNAVYWGLGLEEAIPAAADVRPVGPYTPSPFKFKGFRQGVKPADLALDAAAAAALDGNGGGDEPPPPQPPQPPPPAAPPPLPDTGGLPLRKGEKIALIGGSQASRQALYGHFETHLHAAFPAHELVLRNFGWPGDEAGARQRPRDYNLIDDPFAVFNPDLLICYFGFNESFAGEAGLAKFRKDYAAMLDQLAAERKDGPARRLVLVTPAAFEPTGQPLQPDGREENRRLELYAGAVRELARERDLPLVDWFAATHARAAAGPPSDPWTVHGILLNERGDRELAKVAFQALFKRQPAPADPALRAAVVGKSWLHEQDYRMLNGWYVYGDRRTFDKETFPAEFRKLRHMVANRESRVHAMAAGRTPPPPDDGPPLADPPTGAGRHYPRAEPKELRYPSPEEAIAAMRVPEGLEVRLFASEREFPELANPVQLNFDERGRLWVACMPTYPQWRPGDPKPSDRLLILEDRDGDGKADHRTVFYDRLHIPTGFAFFRGGVLVMDGTRVLWLLDHDGDDRADEVVHWLEGFGTDDSHHTNGAWEWSPGGMLYMLEGVAMTTAVETPWGPLRFRGGSGCYILDPLALRLQRFATPGYGNPWCMVFDEWGQGFIGDGTGGNQHWATPLSGSQEGPREGARPVFNNQGMRPVVGNEWLVSRHLPDTLQGLFTYACVINMNGLPAWTVGERGSGFQGERSADLLASSDKTFRPVDPQIGPDGALWFGDWCNALIGHMQYSQRDPNRDKSHGRIYRLVAKDRPPLQPVVQHGKPAAAILEQLREPEWRTRYRARNALQARPAAEVQAAVAAWLAALPAADPAAEQLRLEGLWALQAQGRTDESLLRAVLASPEPRARAAAVRVLADEARRGTLSWELESLRQSARDPHPRVRLETLRALSFHPTREAVHAALLACLHGIDEDLEYTLRHTLGAQRAAWLDDYLAGTLPVAYNPAGREFLGEVAEKLSGEAKLVRPFRRLLEMKPGQRGYQAAVDSVAALRGDPRRGRVVAERVCYACHRHGDKGIDFAPAFDGVGTRLDRAALVEATVFPNASIAKGFRTVNLTTRDGEAVTGMLLAENAEAVEVRLADGSNRRVERGAIASLDSPQSSSMPEGLVEAMAPREFVDLIEFLAGLK
jgi:putative heme-binding domain-containing protein